MGRTNASIYKFALFLGVLLAYVIVNDVHAGFWIDTPHSSTAITYDSTPGKNIFNPSAPLDTSQVVSDNVTNTNPNPSLTAAQHEEIIPCDTDMDCVLKNPRIIPDGYTINAYVQAYGDDVQFPTTGDCSRVDWQSQDDEGTYRIPFDQNHDGVIDCNSDYELGS